MPKVFLPPDLTVPDTICVLPRVSWDKLRSSLYQGSTNRSLRELTEAVNVRFVLSISKDALLCVETVMSSLLRGPFSFGERLGLFLTVEAAL